MTKKKSSVGSVASVRKEIQRVDRDLVKLLADRAQAAQKMAKLRQDDGAALYDLTEEQQEVAELLTQNKGPLSDAALRSIYREILGAARSLVKPIRVAYLGPKYSFSHLAAIDRFGDGPDLTPVATIKAVFESLHFQQTDYGIVPIENSTDGRIVDTLDMFARLPMRITGEVQLPSIITCSANAAGRSDRGYSKAAGPFAVPRVAGEETCCRRSGGDDQHGDRGADCGR
jgi:chorismate mutase/prephenate dehydratase